MGRFNWGHVLHVGTLPTPLPECVVGQTVQGAVAEDGVIEEAEPFVHGPVAGDDEAG